MAIFKRNEFTSPETSDWFAAFRTLLSEEIAIAVSTIRLLIFRGEFESGELFTTTGAGEAFLVPRVALIGDTVATNDLRALCTSLSILLLVAGHADYLALARNKALSANWLLTLYADKAFLMPLLTSVLVLPHPGLEDALTAITTRRKSIVIAIGAEELVVFCRERTVR